MAYLRELHLPTLRECFEELARRATQESASYEQYLLELVERECQARWAKRTERMLRESRLPLDKDLASFDLSRLPAKVSRQVRTLLEGSFVDRRENLLLFGKTGTGKTHLLSAIAQELVRKGRKVVSWPCALLVQELLVAKRDLKLSRGEAVLEVRSGPDRRHRLRATEPGGDGGALHALGGALRAGHGDAHEQSTVLEVGSDFQGPDDDGGGDRPPGASQRDPGAEHRQLPAGGGQADQAARGGVRDGRGHRRREACRPPFCFAPLRCLHKRGGGTPLVLEGKEGNSNCCSRERIIVAEQVPVDRRI